MRIICCLLSGCTASGQVALRWFQLLNIFENFLDFLQVSPQDSENVLSFPRLLRVFEVAKDSHERACSCNVGRRHGVEMMSTTTVGNNLHDVTGRR